MVAQMQIEARWRSVFAFLRVCVNSEICTENSLVIGKHNTQKDHFTGQWIVNVLKSAGGLLFETVITINVRF
jgi:hypothetical protein